MKNTFLKLVIVIAFFAVTTACNNTGNQPAANDSANGEPINVDTSLAGQHEQILADDSATVQTSVGVKDEEANAKAKLKEDAQKLNEGSNK